MAETTAPSKTKENGTPRGRGQGTPIRNRIKELRYVKAADLLPNEANYRRHPEAQRTALCGILDEIGYADALIAYEHNGGLKLIDGHLRRDVTPGQEVPVLVLDVTAEEAARLLIHLDPLAAMAEIDAEAMGALLDTIGDINQDLAKTLAEMPKWEAPEPEEPPADPEPQLDRAAELQAEWGTASGQLWEIPGKAGTHRLLCGDSTKAEDVERVMGGLAAELVCTDPPYGVAVGDKNKFLNSIAPCNRVEENLENDTLDEDGISAMLRDSFRACAKVCTPGASWYVAAPPGPLHLLFGAVLKDMGVWRQTIQWVKNNATFSPLGVCYHWQAEPIFFGWLPNGSHRWHGGRKETTVWEVDRPQKSPEHPTMKPVELFAKAVRNSAGQGEIVLDPFLGSGTTLVACEGLGRVGVGIEISPAYVAVCLQRMKDLGHKPALATDG